MVKVLNSSKKKVRNLGVRPETETDDVFASEEADTEEEEKSEKLEKSFGQVIEDEEVLCEISPSLREDSVLIEPIDTDIESHELRSFSLELGDQELEKINDSFDLRKEKEVNTSSEGVGKQPSIQATLLFTSQSPAQSEVKKKKNVKDEDLYSINHKLGMLLEMMAISSQLTTEENLPEAVESLNIIKKASDIAGIYGSGISFFQGNGNQGGVVCCDVCFDTDCDLDPSLASKDSFFLGHTNAASYGGKSLALELIASKEKMLNYIEGHHRDWYRFTKTLLDHISCTPSKHGGSQHLQGIIAKKKRDKKDKTILNVVSNQLKAALTIVKIKSAALYYEDLIGLSQHQFKCGECGEFRA